MAYKKQSIKVLGNSLSWLPPADVIAPEDAQDLQNFRVDQAGQLRSRDGASSLGTAGAGPVRTLIKALGARFQQSGTAVYRAFSSVATGFSGEPVGWVDWKKWLWILDQSKQVKDDGTNNRNFAITAPAAKCVAAKGSEFQKNVTTFDNSETWTVDPSGVDSFDGSEKKEGTHSLLLEITGDATYSATRTGLTLDLSSYSGHTATEEDKQRIWLFASKFKKLDSVTLKVDVSSTGGTFAEYYQVVIPRKILRKQGGKGWFRFHVRRMKKEGDKTPFFERIGGDTTRNWSTVTALQVIIDARAAVNVRLDLWDVFGSADAQIEGQDIQYYFTYVNDDEHESNPSPVSDLVAIDKTSVAVSSLTASADAQVTGKYLYRTGGTLTRIWRVSNTKIANATTTYTDTASDADVLALGIEMETDNDPPPAAQILVGPYLGRLIAAQTSARKARLFWSKLNRPWAWPGATSNISGNWVDVGATDEKIVQISQRNNQLWVYKENTIYLIQGDTDDQSGRNDITRAKFGLIGSKAVCKAGEVDYFQFKEGIARFNGDTAIKISQRIDPIFKGQTVTLATGVTIPPVDASSRDKACIEFINDRLYFSYASNGQTTPDVTVVYDVAGDRWYRDSRGFSALYYEGQNGVLQGGRSNGAVWQLETGTDDAGSAIPIVYHSRNHDVGLGDNDKTFEDITIDHNTGGATLTISAYLNDGNTAVTVTPTNTFSSSVRTRTVFQIDSADGVVGRTIAFRITGNASTSPAILYDAVLNYYPEARQARSFDSDESAFGGMKMTRLRELLFDMDNAASVAVTVYSDQPGFAMASRDTATIALSTTRRVERVIVDGDPRGFLHRIVASGSDFRLYGLQGLVQIIGTYLIGSKGEFWKSDPVSWGTERVKLFKELSFECDLSGGTCTYLLETELPGGTLASRATGSIAATTGESTVKIRLPNTIKGRLCRLTLTPASGAEIAVYAARVWTKVIGNPNASSWDWLEFPLEPTQDGIWVPIPVPVDEISAA